MSSEYFLNLTFWLIILSIFLLIFGTTYCICLCCSHFGDYPGKILVYPDSDCPPSAPSSQSQDTAATYYPSVGGAAPGSVGAPYVAMTPGVNISDAPRLAPTVDPSSAPPPSYDQAIQQYQKFYSAQGPAAGLPGLNGPPGPYGPAGALGPPGPHGPAGAFGPGARPPAAYGNTYY